MTELVLGDLGSAKLSSLNSSIGTYRRKMRGLNSSWAAENSVDLLQEVPGTKALHSHIVNEASPFQPLKAGEIYQFTRIIFRNITLSV